MRQIEIKNIEDAINNCIYVEDMGYDTHGNYIAHDDWWARVDCIIAKGEDYEVSPSTNLTYHRGESLECIKVIEEEKLPLPHSGRRIFLSFLCIMKIEKYRRDELMVENHEFIEIICEKNLANKIKALYSFRQMIYEVENIQWNINNPIEYELEIENLEELEIEDLEELEEI